MMDNTRIDAAVASAQVALASEEFSWIRDSALRERPYVFGLLEGLRALADNEHQVDRLLPRLLLPTLHTRRADAPVTSTETWRAFEEFRGLLMGEDAETPAVLAAKERLLSRVANLERHWAALIGSVKEALEAVPLTSDVPCGHSESDEKEVRARRADLCERLERAVCRLSQLELEPETI